MVMRALDTRGLGDGDVRGGGSTAGCSHCGGNRPLQLHTIKAPLRLGGRRHHRHQYQYQQRRCRPTRLQQATHRGFTTIQAQTRRKILPSKKALEHFDDFYRKIFGPQWPSIRIALLSPHKYCAVVNNFGDTGETVTYLQNRGAINIQTFLEMGKSQSIQQNEHGTREKSESVSKLDQKIQKITLSKQMEENEELYPSTEQGTRLTPDINTSSENKSDVISKDFSYGFSLDNARRLAQIDESRVIDPSVGLGSGTLYEFIPATELKGLEDRVLDSDHYGYYSTESDFPLSIQKEFDINYPSHLNLFVYERGSVMPFESPKRGSTGVLNYYLLDGASILPVLALGIEAGDVVLDMCAAPGGKSLLMLQSLHTGRLVCNDVQESRVKRIKSVLHQYIYDLPKWKNEIEVTRCDGRSIQEENMYDKILVDVPCTNDRLSLHEDDNSIFNAARIKERLSLPELQSELLMNALKLVKPGGIVVYSTCSLSPIQNDGVVHMALRKIWEDTKIEVEVRDLSPALGAVEPIFKLADNIGLKYGHLVLPYLPCNFGPLYFCKLLRVK